ncbi:MULTISPECIES: 30S ribosomal protein S10 [16SrII (Peanut WB group)]|uniref:Small ribosomal subunit protein uS10 n=3 Tax=16SrII (Peanut WB group) TaxID=85621 RepID=A0A1S9M3R1_9MOLU|nr:MULTISPECIES: 30S ribosomal protein S10 [Phytoplasma]MDO8053891.1 30S ribosomal protein S10 ['Opuntia sp.' phytoplasma]MDO8057246.1 30S ribosomal protein S10 ['Gossypium sp.' phytoplasma]MDO8057699.1 30S ribosomal protein S10 ['Opuntia sp.' phytoplasma]MDO8060151.1 30S ribosomal protein S10 [Candidatus Phytoplasma aurantifolia]MDO8078708.1 30S ribosomal protein S10 [Candidatus Phytoplasma aurantifolia]
MKKKSEIFQICLKTYDFKMLESTVKKIIDSIVATGAEIKGPIPLPTRKEIFTVLRSTFVHKDSREQFGRFTHKRLIQIINPNAKTIDALTRINVPKSVDISIKQ